MKFMPLSERVNDIKISEQKFRLFHWFLLIHNCYKIKFNEKLGR